MWTAPVRLLLIIAALIRSRGSRSTALVARPATGCATQVRGVPSIASSPFRHLWALRPDVAFLNHGSFGACPRSVLARQSELRDSIEAEPVEFLARRLEPEIDEARRALGEHVGAAPSSLVFVPNATTGVNTVLASLGLAAGDDVLVIDHVYAACRNAARVLCERSGAKVRTVPIPFPLPADFDVAAAIAGSATARTRIALIDHITSATGLVLPVGEIVAALSARGVETLIDGAHAPGMVSLDLARLGAAYYTANAHKWLSSPKGAAFLQVREDLQPSIRPLVISHGASSTRTDRSRVHLEFDWTGTFDPTAVLSVPTAIAMLGGLLPGGWDELRRHNRELTLRGREELATALGVELPCTDESIGALATLPLPDRWQEAARALGADPLRDRLYREHRIEVLVTPLPPDGRIGVRISGMIYVTLDEIRRVPTALRSIFGD